MELNLGFSLDLKTPPSPLNVKGLFYNFLHSRNPDILNDDHGFTIEGTSLIPFSWVGSTHHFITHLHSAATFPRGFDLTPLLPPTPPPLLSMETSVESSDGVAVHGQLEFKSLFDCSPVDHRFYHDLVMVNRQIMPLLDLNDLRSLNRLSEEFSSGGLSSDCQWGHERDEGGDDRSKREVVIGLPQQQLKQTTGKK